MSISRLTHVVFRTFSRYQSVLERQEIGLHPQKGAPESAFLTSSHSKLSPWVCSLLLECQGFTVLSKGSGSGGESVWWGQGGWGQNLVLLDALHLLEFHTFCKLRLINLPLSGRAWEADTLPLFHRWRGGSAEGM